MTKLLFLGTGAADYHMERDLNIEGFRALSGMLIDGHIMIDCGPGAFVYEDKNKADGIYSEVDTVFVTHSHDDHFGTQYVSRLCRESKKNITIYGDKALEALLPKEENLTFVALDAKYHESVKVGGYTVTALKSNHATRIPEEQTHHYFFEGEKNFFIGYDGGWLIADTWEFLEKKYIDVYVTDATCGDDFECTYNFRNYSHNNRVMIDMIYDTAINCKVMDKNSKLIMTHLAKTLHPSHKEVELSVKDKGYIVAYDGFTYEF